MQSPVVALLVSDLHLSHKPPLARSKEVDWYAVQKRYLDQIDTLAKSCGKDVPILCAGDIFDKWNPPPELINFALQYLPEFMYCIPGQHDLPYHRYEDKKRSAYWTLVEAVKIMDLEPGKPVEWLAGPHPLRLWGFPWGCEITPLEDPFDLYLEVAVIHSYVWIPGHEYPGASESQRGLAYRKRLKGFDVAVFGDNHSPFILASDKKPQIVNCGTFLRRKQDERHLYPRVGLLHADGHVTAQLLDCSADVFLDSLESIPASQLDMAEFLAELTDVAEGSALDFRDAILRYLDNNGVEEQVKDIILRALEGGDNKR